MTGVARIAAAAVASGAIALLTMSASTAEQAPGGTARDLAVDLCKSVAADGPLLEISGPRARWSVNAASADARAATVEFVRKITKAPAFLVSGNRAWVVVHKVDASTTVLINCLAQDSAMELSDLAATQVAVSEFGDVALRLKSGDITLVGRPDDSKRGLASSAPMGVKGVPGPLLWSGRRLFVLGGNKAVAIDLTPNGYSTRDLSIPGLPEGIVSAWSYRGLTFALAQDGCLDMLVDTTLAPRLRQVACIPRAQVGRSYIAFDPDSTRVLTPDGDVIWEGERLLALSARLTGTVREITANLHSIANAPWTPSVPVALGGPVVLSSESLPAASQGLKWDRILLPPYWASTRGYSEGIDALDKNGWSNLRDDGTWITGTGIALRWQTGPDFVTPSGRSLSAIAAELYHGETYSNDQIQNLLVANATLGRSLEGRLFQLGWIPVGAAYGPGDQAPLGFAGVRAVAALLGGPKRSIAEGAARAAVEPFKTVKPAESCDFANAVRDESLTALVANGISVVGRSGAPPQVSQSTNLQLKAASADVVRCSNAAGVPLRMLVLKGVVLNTDEGRDKARAGEPISASANGVTFSASQDASWPVAVQPDVVAAVAPESATVHAQANVALLRQWLDDVFVHKRVDRVLIRVSFLEAVVAADVSWHPRTESIPKVRLVPAERVSAVPRARARFDPACDTQAAVLEQQRLYDELLNLNAIAPASRVVDVPLVGIVENAVMLSEPMFKRSDGRLVWEELDSQQRFTVLTEGRPVPVDRHSRHGTRVAGVLFSVTPPTGILSDARLTWIDASTPDVNQLTQMAGTKDIVNFSASVEEGWNSLLAEARRSWSSLLFVAAAHNKDEHANPSAEDDARENEDGLPIAWRLSNTIGVGVARPPGETPQKVLTSYVRDQVDLLAPGYMVPAVGPHPDLPLCLDGTSFAAAYVSAVAALIQQKAQGGLTASQLRARLLATATWKPEYWEHVKGGLVNARRALDGLFENILTFPSADNGALPGLEVTIKLTEQEFKASGVEFGAVPESQTDSIYWSDVLRLTKTGETTDAAGRPQSLFYMAFVAGDRFKVWRDVRINVETSAMPITQCIRRSDNVTITCSATDVNGIFDYVGQRYRHETKIKFF